MPARPGIPDYNKLMGGVDLFRLDEQLLCGLEEGLLLAYSFSFQLLRDHQYQLVHLVSKLFRQGEFAYMGCLVDINIQALPDQS